MGNNTSPLESLAAFAIVFVAGAASAAGLSIYTRWVRVRAFRDGGNSRGVTS
jgi:hypothetical protein